MMMAGPVEPRRLQDSVATEDCLYKAESSRPPSLAGSLRISALLVVILLLEQRNARHPPRQ